MFVISLHSPIKLDDAVANLPYHCTALKYILLDCSALHSTEFHRFALLCCSVNVLQLIIWGRNAPLRCRLMILPPMSMDDSRIASLHQTLLYCSASLHRTISGTSITREGELKDRRRCISASLHQTIPGT